MSDREYPKEVKGDYEAQKKWNVFCRLDAWRNKDGYRDKQEETRQFCKSFLKELGLSDDELHAGQTVKWCELPHPDPEGSYATEAIAILEREVWWPMEWDNLGEQMQHYRKANGDWLEDKRKQIYHDAEGDEHADPDHKPWGWDEKNRRNRYDNLQIATRYGSAYDDWKATHDFETGKPKKSGRDLSKQWHENHLGITESPADSNCDSRDDGIRNAQDTCANGTWLRYQPWCGVWAFMGLYKAGLVESGTDSWMASVASIEDYARNARGPFRGWTTDGSKAKTGDLVILFGRGVHVGTVRETPSGDTCKTWEGNTSSGSSGSQSNGGGSYKRERSRSAEVYGYALVDF